MSVDYTLALNYQLQSGWLQPYVQGLLQGHATARCCIACNRTSFPPIRVCKCQHTEGTWTRLSGAARIVHRCDGTDGSFALVQFDGADTQTVVRLDAMPETDQLGYLRCPQSANSFEAPALVLTAYQHKTDSGTVDE